jgi:hypothetical protein
MRLFLKRLIAAAEGESTRPSFAGVNDSSIVTRVQDAGRMKISIDFSSRWQKRAPIITSRAAAINRDPACAAIITNRQ